MSLNGLAKRLRKLELASKDDCEVFYMPDGSKVYMSADRAERAYHDAFHGRFSSDTDTILNCVGQSDGRMAELTQAVCNSKSKLSNTN